MTEPKEKLRPPILRAFILVGLGLFVVLVGIFLWQPGSVNRYRIISDESGVILEGSPDLPSDDPLTASGQADDQPIDNSSVASQYRLIINKIGVNMPVAFGNNERQALLRGAWHIPGSGTPDQPDGYKNIVLSGHRYLYTSGPKTFFNLDKLAKGDEIILEWLGQEYQYVVEYTQVVEPEDVWVLNDSGINKLTLFTCTPPFTTKQRLIVVAYPAVK